MGVLARTMGVQRGEGRLTALVAGMMFVAMAALTIGESAIEALFFDRVGPQALPVVYVLQGGTALLAMLGLTQILRILGPRRAYLSAPLLLAVIVLGGRALLVTEARVIYPGLWVAVAVATLVQGMFLWGIAQNVADIRQAKRLYPVFGAGGILGSVVGGLLTRPLALTMGAENLLLVWAGGLGVVFIFCRELAGGPSRAERARWSARQVSGLQDMARVFAFVSRSRFLTWMAVAAVPLSILFYLLYLPFARAASERYPDADALAGFFGLFWAAGTGTAFLVSMLVTRHLLVRFGVASTAVVLPVLYGIAFGLLLLLPGFLTLVLLRFVIGTWLQAVASPAWEALLNVVPESRRDQVETFLHGGPTQVGTMVAGLIAIGSEQTLSVRQYAAIGVVGALVAAITTIGIRSSYIGALVEGLREGRPQVFEHAPVRNAAMSLPVDADAVQVLSEAARSTDVRDRRLAFQLLAEVPDAVRPSDFDAGVDDDDPTVRMAVVRALDLSRPAAGEACLLAMQDPDPAVAAAAAARMLGLDDDAGSMARLGALLGHPDARVRRAAVQQLGVAPAQRAGALAWPLIEDSDPDVRATALERAVDADPGRGLEPAIAGLRDPEPVVRMAAGRALGRLGGRAVDHVLQALEDPRTVSAAIEAVRRLTLSSEDAKVREFVRRAAARATLDHELASAVPPRDDVHALLHDALLDDGRRAARSGLWAASMLELRRVPMEIAIENLDGPPAQLAKALEALETAGSPTLLRPLIALWEPAPVSPKVKDWLSLALGHENEFIRLCAEFVRARTGGEMMTRSPTVLSMFERLLFLRRVPLFVDLPPADLQHVAERAEERGFADGEPVAVQGEAGEELHIVVEGTIRVVQRIAGADHVLARRRAGDVIGEMALITEAPRIASLIAERPVRTIRLGRREFESMLRERPEVALALMRVLAQRLDESGHRAEIAGS